MSDEHHDVIVERDSGGGLGSGMIIGLIIAALIVAIGVWYFGFGPGAGQRGTDINVDVNLPSVPAPSG